MHDTDGNAAARQAVYETFFRSALTRPPYYNANPDGKETIDRIRDLARQWAEEAPESEWTAIADLLFAFHCEATALKYRDRAGKKPGNDADADLAKARWYEAMAGHVIEGGPDPRNPVEPPCATCAGAGEDGGCPTCGMVPW